MDGTYYEAADWVVDGYDRGVYWLCARDGRVLWDTATTGRVVGVDNLQNEVNVKTLVDLRKSSGLTKKPF